jgi:hypothetical protein
MALKTFQYLINKMREDGCLHSDDERTSLLAHVILQGALSATPVRPRSWDWNQSYRELAPVWEAGSEPVFAPDYPLPLNREVHSKFALARSILENALKNNLRSRWYLYYKFGEVDDICVGEGANSRDCHEFQSSLRANVLRINLEDLQKMIAEVYQSAQKKFAKALAEVRNPKSGLSADDAAAYDPFEDYRNEVRRVWSLPGFKEISYAQSFENDHEVFLSFANINKICLPQNESWTCRFQIGHSRLRWAPPRVAELRAYLTEILRNLADVNEKIVQPWEGTVAGLARRLPITTSDPQGVRPDDPADQALQWKRGARIKTVNGNVEDLLYDMIQQRPLEIGAALIEHPQFAANICEDVRSVTKRMSNEAIWTAVRTTILVGATLTFMMPTFGLGGLFASAALGIYDLPSYTAAAHVLQNNALDTVERALVAGLTREGNLTAESMWKSRDQAQAARRSVFMFQGLAALGLIAPIAEIATVPRVRIASAGVNILRVKSLLNVIRVEVGSRAPRELLRIFYKMAMPEEWTGATVEYSRESRRAFKELTSLVGQANYESEIPFQE